ncbi:MAG: hypothetical protein ACLUFX_12505 [Oscillospiraceae bacterium]|jgi:hypothetical protein|nr:hypothetical protein [Ruminococcus sp.]
MNTDIFTNIVQLALTCGIGVVAFFLKRTISELDECKQNISDMKEKFIKRSELDECKKDIAQVKADYITREDFFREQDNTRRQLDKIMSVLLEIKGDSKQ